MHADILEGRLDQWGSEANLVDETLVIILQNSYTFTVDDVITQIETVLKPRKLRCLGYGQPPAGWFPLPDAVGLLLGCHPSASRSLPSTSLEQLWDLGRLLYNYNAVTVEGD